MKKEITNRTITILITIANSRKDFHLVSVISRYCSVNDCCIWLSREETKSYNLWFNLVPSLSFQITRQFLSFSALLSLSEPTVWLLQVVH